MAKCIFCGKSGLFLFVNAEGLCKNCARNPVTQKYEKMKVQNQHDNALFDSQIGRINAAREQFDKDKDLNKIIAVYEQVLLKEDIKWNAYTHRLALSEYYLKAGRNDDSWGMLNKLLFMSPNMNHRTRYAMFKQLKKENRYKEALRMLFITYYDKNNGLNYFKNEFTDKFEKEAMVVAKKLSWAETDVKELRNLLDGLIMKTVNKPNPDEKVAFDTVDRFLKNK